MSIIDYLIDAVATPSAVKMILVGLFAEAIVDCNFLKSYLNSQKKPSVITVNL